MFKDKSFEKKDCMLLNHKGNIIHQIWFGIIPNKKEAAETLKTLEKFQNTWIDNNKDMFYMLWGYNDCKSVVKLYYPEIYDMYIKYPYHIQRCDAVRYCILHRYGGMYADMDYICNRPISKILEEYTNDLYLVETPNAVGSNNHVSNSLMYSKPGNIFWKKLLFEMELHKEPPSYCGRHMSIMFTTGPAILNRTFNKWRFRYNIKSFPYQKFHPYGLDTDIKITKLPDTIYAAHLGKGSWESQDSKILIFFYKEYKFTAFILLFALVLPLILKYYS